MTIASKPSTSQSSTSQPGDSQQRLTLQDYLAYDDGTDARYELVDGMLVEMGAESPLNPAIASFLLVCFAQLGIPSYRLAIGHQLAVSSTMATARQPDLIVHSEGSAAAIYEADSILLPEMPVPLLVVEVVSNSDTDKKSRDRDYQEKRLEYAVRGIPEYWIIDPIAALVMVLTLDGTQYQEQRFLGEQKIVSPLFPELALTARQVLGAGR